MYVHIYVYAYIHTVDVPTLFLQAASLGEGSLGLTTSVLMRLFFMNRYLEPTRKQTMEAVVRAVV